MKLYGELLPPEKPTRYPATCEPSMSNHPETHAEASAEPPPHPPTLVIVQQLPRTGVVVAVQPLLEYRHPAKVLLCVPPWIKRLCHSGVLGTWSALIFADFGVDIGIRCGTGYHPLLALISHNGWLGCDVCACKLLIPRSWLGFAGGKGMVAGCVRTDGCVGWRKGCVRVGRKRGAFGAEYDAGGSGADV